jgi:hypothetical protein
MVFDVLLAWFACGFGRPATATSAQIARQRRNMLSTISRTKIAMMLQHVQLSPMVSTLNTFRFFAMMSNAYMQFCFQYVGAMEKSKQTH